MTLLLLCTCWSQSPLEALGFLVGVAGVTYGGLKLSVRDPTYLWTRRVASSSRAAAEVQASASQACLSDGQLHEALRRGMGKH